MEKNKKKKPIKPVVKPYLKGEPWDRNSLKTCLFFFISLFGVMFGFLILGGMLMWDNFLLRLVSNLMLVGVVYAIYFYNGASRGTVDVNAGEILYTRRETGRSVDEDERRRCFHPLKGFVIGLVGSLPLLLVGIVFACIAQQQLYGHGALPSWVSGIAGRAEVGDAIAYYTQGASMNLEDILRLIVRLSIMPYVSILGTESSASLLSLERLCMLPLMLPALFYGFGYSRGVAMRTRIHTDIARNKRKARKKQKQLQQQKKQEQRLAGPKKGPQQLN